jgi:hypothetical protein
MHVKRGKLVRCNNYFHCAAITCNKGVINDRIITSAVVHKLNYRLVLVQLATCRRRRSKVTPQNLSGKITLFFPFCTFPSFSFLSCRSSSSINVDVLTLSLPTHPRLDILHVLALLTFRFFSLFFLHFLDAPRKLPGKISSPISLSSFPPTRLLCTFCVHIRHSVSSCRCSFGTLPSVYIFDNSNNARV